MADFALCMVALMKTLGMKDDYLSCDPRTIVILPVYRYDVGETFHCDPLTSDLRWRNHLNASHATLGTK